MNLYASENELNIIQLEQMKQVGFAAVKLHRPSNFGQHFDFIDVAVESLEKHHAKATSALQDRMRVFELANDDLKAENTRLKKEIKKAERHTTQLEAVYKALANKLNEMKDVQQVIKVKTVRVDYENLERFIGEIGYENVLQILAISSFNSAEFTIIYIG